MLQSAEIKGEKDNLPFYKFMPKYEDIIDILSREKQHADNKAESDFIKLSNAAKDAINCPFPLFIDKVIINPSLSLIPFTHKNLPETLIKENNKLQSAQPNAQEFVLVWNNFNSQSLEIIPASSENLLILKIMIENISPESVAKESGLPVGAIDQAIERAVNSGILLSPPSLIRRNKESWGNVTIDESFITAKSFTLQWHITQSCDLYCKHCYDRSDRTQMSLKQALTILDDFKCFCKSRYVSGCVSFTGGNPLLFPHFREIYSAASDYGFSLCILGNPTSRDILKSIVEIHKPSYFQVSLEGLHEHNDLIRGKGHFDRTIKFLELLREFDVYSMVMLTLTLDNIKQVIPLATLLRTLADSFFFNRLSTVGEGAQLVMPDRNSYKEFLKSYMKAMESNPVMGLKDNLFNILLYQKGMPLFCGCAGFGCSAAFNFVSLLADGEVHACRKFPSPIGNIFTQRLAEIYDSEAAHRYRQGCSECSSCAIRPVCGGCLSSAHSKGLDIFTQKDPYCFYTQ